MAELLLSKGYEVHGLIRRASTFNTGRIEHIYVEPHDPSANIFLHYGDLSDASQLTHIIYDIQPEEIYHFGAQSHVRLSFDMAEYTGNVTGLGTTRILEAVRRSGISARFYQASSSEMFGAAPPPQNESTPFYPRSPYAAAKVYAYWMSVNFREAYNMFISNGILFNHESPRRGEVFVTKKITRTIANIIAGKEKYLYLGNLEAKRDWGYTPEYVMLTWMMLQQEKPGDYVVGTGETHSVEEFVKAAFEYAGLDWQEHVKIDPYYFRPTEVEVLKAGPDKARKELKWDPRITFSKLIKVMVDADMRRMGLKPVGEGDNILNEVFPDRWWKVD